MSIDTWAIFFGGQEMDKMSRAIKSLLRLPGWN